MENTNLSYKFSRDNVHIDSSFFFDKREIPVLVGHLLSILPEDCEVRRRTSRSLILEWYAHNLLFRMNIRRDRTRDVDLNYPQRWWEVCFYPVIGVIGWIFLD